MDINSFFEPLNEELLEKIRCGCTAQSLFTATHFLRDYSFSYEECDIIIMGCPHRYGSEQDGSELAPDTIRQFLYALAAPLPSIHIADLGNLKLSEGEEPYALIQTVLQKLLAQNKTVILLGGTHDTAYGQFLAYEGLEKNIEYVSIDSRLDLLDAEMGLSNRTFHNQMLRHKPNYLSHFVNIGTQIYYVTEAEREVVRRLQLESQRLSEFRANVKRAEPFFRQVDMVSIDLSAVRQSDAPGVNYPCPAGFTIEEVCQLARFCGMGYHVSSISVNELNPLNDINDQTAHLAAILLWHFIEGFYHRIQDEPTHDRSNLRCFIAEIEDNIIETITFYKSELTGRWWMEVPFPNQGKKLSAKLSKLIPCCEEDYLLATTGEIPERWWLMHCKFLEEWV